MYDYDCVGLITVIALAITVGFFGLLFYAVAEFIKILAAWWR